MAFNPLLCIYAAISLSLMALHKYETKTQISCHVSHVVFVLAAPPYATCLPDQMRLKPGDALVVQCLAHGSHPISFTWTRVGRTSLPAAAVATADGRLMIAHVRQNDSGTYKCVATNHIGTSEAQAKVIVKGDLAISRASKSSVCFMFSSSL